MIFITQVITMEDWVICEYLTLFFSVPRDCTSHLIITSNDIGRFTIRCSLLSSRVVAVKEREKKRNGNSRKQEYFRSLLFFFRAHQPINERLKRCGHKSVLNTYLFIIYFKSTNA